ncbi:MAG: hypothetical protein C0596_04465 [Marinilabiliales bacterium]|nr:MAG: hypothetical protein C0596_04465 [Marinilabiliales bacterium]
MFKKLNNISISYKLSGIITLLIIISMLFVGIFTYTTNKEAIISRTYEQLTSVRFEKTQRLVNFLNTKVLEIGQFANTSDAVSIFDCVINNDTATPKSIKIDEFNRFIGDYLRMQGQVNRFLIYSDSGIYSINPSQTTDSFDVLQLPELKRFIDNNANKTETIISDLMINDKDEIVFFIFTELKCEKNGIYIGFEIPSHQINNIMLEDNPYNGLGASGEVYLVGDDRLMRSQSRFVDNSALKIKVPNPIFDNPNPEKSGTNMVLDYRDVKVLSSYGIIDWGSTQWLIFAEIDYKEALIPVDAFRDSMIFLGLLGTLMFTAVVMILIFTITKPVAKLKKAADEIAEGNYNVQVHVKNNDEIGQLSHTFNQMSQKIDEQKKKLDYDRMNRVQEMIDWQENERQRLSRELHDGIGQLLLSVKMRLGRIKGKTNNDDGIIEDTQNILQQTVKDVRDISNNLMPSVLKEFGLIKGVENLSNDVSLNYNIDIEFETNIDKIDNLKVSTYLYRIIQEALTNTIKHANANKIDIKLIEQNDVIKLEIKDNGKGFITEAMVKSHSNGLRNIRERSKLLNGTCKISSNIDQGTEIFVEIPKQ